MASDHSTSSGTELSAVPPAAMALGAAGLIPFVGCLLIGLLAADDLAGLAMLALRGYGACILSFMGGVHWGLAIHPAAPEADYGRLGASVVPALVAWAALLLPPYFGYLVLATAFAGLLAYDLAATRKGLAPAWYPKLRVPLTVVVTLCLLLAPLA